MNNALTRCPVCQNELTITRLHCESCDTSLEGRFTGGPFAHLTREQMDFIMTFIRCEGKLNRVETELGLSYPTLRNRLHEIIRALGYEPGKEESPDVAEDRRRQVLEDLDAGKLSADAAMRILRGEEASTKYASVNGPVTVSVENVGGDLQIVGWERAEVTAKTDDSKLGLTADGETIHASSDGDLILYVARDASVRVLNVGGDADIRALAGSVEVTNVGGDLQLRNVGAVRVVAVGGDMSMRGCTGAFQANSVGGDASLHEIKGDIDIVVGADLYLRGAEGNVNARVGSDAALYLRPQPGTNVNIRAGSDVLLRLPAKADVELDLQGCDDESIRVDLPGVESVQMGMSRKVVMGSGGARIKAVAGSEVIVTSRDEEWENVAEFDPLGRDGPFSAGEFPGLSSELHERISRRVEAATRRALESSMRAQDQSDRVQRRVDAAMRRAEEKMRSAERRSMHMGIKVGRFGATIERPSVPPIPPMPLRPPAEPVTDEERLTILKMLQDKKISLQGAEKLLAALEGK